ncbi:putative tricarboxylic transport membrane protein [Marinimicrobium koreense]|uniref:Putative tricarboxylic transport membrane protein n=1 Tax=Marinimicrobium koreense TaxID=306545 RepID=A0A3N1P043_9GAMM|nr:tripartite tricarboxylate transporter TctB family protein [Marinimicrobium koreense]ROQ20968.1 putative tricarboxylic transport membrane protein [Marinimicrobium koreense]
MSRSFTERLNTVPTDRWFGLATIGCSGLLYSIFWQDTLKPTLGDPGPTLLPGLIAVLLTLMGLILLIRPPTDREPAEETDNAGTFRPWRGAFSIVAVLAYAWVLPNLGYAVSTAVFFALSTWLLGRLSLRAGVQCCLIAILVAVATHYLLASVLNVSLPEGEWLYALKGVLYD